MPGPDKRVYRHVCLIMQPHRPQILHGIFHIPPPQVIKIPTFLSDTGLSKRFLVRMSLHGHWQIPGTSVHSIKFSIPWKWASAQHQCRPHKSSATVVSMVSGSHSKYWRADQCFASTYSRRQGSRSFSTRLAAILIHASKSTVSKISPKGIRTPPILAPAPCFFR